MPKDEIVHKPSRVLPTVTDLVVAVDCETSGLHPDDGARVSVVSVAWWNGTGDYAEPVVQSYAFPFAQGVDKAGPPNLDRDEWNRLCAWLRDQNLVMHNAKFDLTMLRAGVMDRGQGGGGWAGVDLRDRLLADTMIMAHTLWPTESSALKATAKRLWGEDEGEQQDRVKAALKRNGVGLTKRYDLLDWEVIGPYAAKDAEQTLRLAQHAREVLHAGEHSYRTVSEAGELILRRTNVMLTLTGMEWRGIGYDVEASLAAANVAQEAKDLTAQTVPFTPITPIRARQFFYQDPDGPRATPHCITDKGGQPSTGECCVRQLVKAGVPGAAEYAEWGKISHAISKYYLGYAERCGTDGRLRTDFRQLGTVSGRFSSSRVNLQALPHDYRLEALERAGVPAPRSLFRAKPGHQLWEFDLGQAELRVAAKYAECTRMIELIEAGADVHSQTAIDLFGEATFENRQVAKRANFSLIFSVGPDTFNRDVEKQTGIRLGQTRAREIVYKWRDLYPEIPAANRAAERVWLSRRYVRLAGGAQRWMQWTDRSYAAFNQAVQGSIAEFVQMWLIQVDHLFPGMLVLTVHDSLALEIPDEQVHRVSQQVVNVGQETGTRLFGIPMVVDAKEWKTGG